MLTVDAGQEKQNSNVRASFCIIPMLLLPLRASVVGTWYTRMHFYILFTSVPAKSTSETWRGPKSMDACWCVACCGGTRKP